MAIRSHVDLCFFVRFVHVRQDQIPPNVLQTLVSTNSTTDMLSDAWVEQMAATTQITFHETYHFWQGLRLPFLHRYALLSFFEIAQAFKKLSGHYPELHDWDCLLPALDRLSLQDKVWVVPDGSLYCGRYEAPIAEAVIGPLMLSPLDLLEGSTSLAEFQVHVSAPDRTDPKAFSRWAKRHPAYTEAYGFLAQYLKDEALTLRCFIPLVNAAFHTSEPVRAFAMLAQTLKFQMDFNENFKEFLRPPEPRRWDQLCHHFLDNFEYEAAPDSDAKILGSPFHRLTLRNWVYNETFPHPFLSPMARKWCEGEDADPVNTWLLSQPGWAVEKVLAQMVDFSPTLSLVRFHIDGKHDRLIAINGNLPENLQGPLLVDLMTLYSTVRRASGSHFDADSRLCHHSECPEYGPNFCNCFPKIPTDYRACEFRHRVAALRESPAGRSIT